MIIVSKHNFLPYIAPVLIQNEEIIGKHQLIVNDVYAGKNVDNGRTSGDVIIKAGASITINAAGSVNLTNGFSVEKGATLIITKQ